MAKQGASTVVPRLRFPEFRGGWMLERFGTLGTFIGGGTPDKSVDAYWDGTIPWVSSSDILEDNVNDLRVSRYITVTAVSESATKMVPMGSLLFVSRVGVGKVAIADRDVCTSQDFTNFQPESLLNRFIAYFFSANKQVLKSFGQGTSIKGFTKEDLANFQMPFPSRDEQQRIADCLTSLDEVIAAQGRKVEVLKAHKRGLMQQLFPREGETRPRLRFPEFRNAPEWREREVGDVFQVTRGQVLAMPLVKNEQSCETPYPVYSSQTKNRGLAGYFSNFLYEDAITWTTDGANAGEVNYREGKFYCTNVCGVLLSTEGYANPCIAELLNSVTRSHVSYVGNPKLMNGVMAKITIPFPSLEEQQRIADCLSSLDTQITTESEQLTTLKAHKQGLMQQLFPVPEAASA